MIMFLCVSTRPDRRSPPIERARASPCSRSSIRHRLTLAALTGGYHLSYVVAAVFVAIGILAALLVLRSPSRPITEAIDSELERIETVQAGEPVAQAA